MPTLGGDKGMEAVVTVDRPGRVLVKSLKGVSYRQITPAAVDVYRFSFCCSAHPATFVCWVVGTNHEKCTCHSL